MSMKLCFYCKAKMEDGEVYVNPIDHQECCRDCMAEDIDARAMDADGHDLLDVDFADPGGRSALRAATLTNPRVYPCPTCGVPDTLTAQDVRLHYQCNRCADALERGAP